MPEKRKIKGREVRIWEQSFSILNRENQEYYFTGVVFVHDTPNLEMIESLCIALDSAYEAGKSSVKKEFRTWLEL